MTDKLAYNATEAAAALGVSVRSIWGAIKNKKLETRKIFGRTLIPAASLMALIDAETPKPDPEPALPETRPMPSSTREGGRSRRRGTLQLPPRHQ